MSAARDDAPIVIRKYQNRRLYDTANSRYVNLGQIAGLVKEGRRVEVVDAATGDDLTKVILTQIIMEEEKGQRNLLPAPFLHQLIQYGEAAYGEMAEQVLTAGLTAYRAAQERMESTLLGWLKPWADSAPAAGETERLRARIAELEAALEAREKPPRPE